MNLSSSATIVQLARQVLNIAETHSNEALFIHEDLLQSIRKLQVAAEGPAHYVIRKRHQVYSHRETHREHSQQSDQMLG